MSSPSFIKATRNNVSYIQLASWSSYGLHAGFGNNSLDLRSDLSSWQNFSDREVLLLNQVHGDEFIDLRNLAIKPEHLLSSRFSADGWIVDFSRAELQSFAFGIETADCVPVLIASSSKPLVALCHCGWRSAVAKLLDKVLRAIICDVDLNSIEIAIGPCASSMRYEIGADVAEKLNQAWSETGSKRQSSAVISRHGKLYGDIVSLLHQQAIMFGVPAEHVAVINECTIDDESYFSYRRDPNSPGRQVSFIERLSSN